MAVQVIKRRLEQIDGVGLVDINGTVNQRIIIEINNQKIQTVGLTPDQIASQIKDANIELGSIAVRDGNYRYFLKIIPVLQNRQDLMKLPILLPQGGYMHLNELASINQENEPEQGLHLFKNKRAIVIAVHKQPSARMPELMPVIYKSIEQFKIDYPQIDLVATQDQSLLLTFSIQNMSSALLWGGFFAFLVLFLFMGNWREPVVMGIVLPVSLVLSFSFLFLFGLSLNVISLSGLALGLGMLVDNSIVVLDSIMMKRREGKDLLDSCVRGTTEVMVPLLSSALTNMAVFVPLIFISGITGALFYDQALSVAAILTASLFCTFVLVPIAYLLLFKNRLTRTREDSQLLIWLRNVYHQSLLTVWEHKKKSLALMVVLFPLAILFYQYLPVQTFPDIQRTESLVKVNWNEPISLQENRDRVNELLVLAAPILSETDAGFRQFIFGLDQFPVQQSTVYLKFSDPSNREDAHERLSTWFKQKYPQAQYEIGNSPNPFEQVFESHGPSLEARFRDVQLKRPIDISRADSLISAVKSIAGNSTPGPGLEKETVISIVPDIRKLALFKIPLTSVAAELTRILTDVEVTEMKSFQDHTSVVFRGNAGDFHQKMERGFVFSLEGARFALRDFIQTRYELDYQSLTADASGIYQSIVCENAPETLANRDAFVMTASSFGLVLDWAGTWFEDQSNRQTLLWIMLVSLGLMYFILTAEFESFRQPFIVLSSFPLGIAGSLLLIWMAGGSINIMSGIGLVVVLGILDNDAILKIDRINRLRKTLPLEKAIIQAGLDRFKPIVMNTLTNVLAISPIIFSSGLGADLQRPVALATVGGLIVATFTAVYYIPLVYWFASKK